MKDDKQTDVKQVNDMDNDFFLLVEEMRRAQKLYFRTRTYIALEESKLIERKVDDAIKRHKEERKEKGTQASLFD